MCFGRPATSAWMPAAASARCSVAIDARRCSARGRRASRRAGARCAGRSPAAGSGTPGPPAPTSAARCRAGWPSGAWMSRVSCASARRSCVGAVAGARACAPAAAPAGSGTTRRSRMIASSSRRRPSALPRFALGMQAQTCSAARWPSSSTPTAGISRAMPAAAGVPAVRGATGRIAAAITSPSASSVDSDASVSASTAGRAQRRLVLGAGRLEQCLAQRRRHRRTRRHRQHGGRWDRRAALGDGTAKLAAAEDRLH